MPKYATMSGVWDLAKVLDSPLLGSLHPTLRAIGWPAIGWPGVAEYQSALDGLGVCNALGAPLRIVTPPPQPSPSWQRAYEPRIYFEGALATRQENWHDCFNLLSWCTYPRAKAALNARHIALQHDIEAATCARTPAQDAVIQFDESGVILTCADAELHHLLHAFEWKKVFWERRAMLDSALRCFVFGHGLMEKALAPYTGLTGKALLLSVPPSFMHLSDAQQVQTIDGLSAAFIHSVDVWREPRALLPFPMLGMPGFVQENASASYYDNTDYFRPQRQVKA